MNVVQSNCSPSYQVHCIATTAPGGSSQPVDQSGGKECLIFTSVYQHIRKITITALQGHTSKDVNITVPAGKVSALYAGDCRFKSLPGMSLLAGNFCVCALTLTMHSWR